MFIIGPTLYTDASLMEGFESGALVQKIMTGAFPMVPRMGMGISDVRDVAQAHILALSQDAAAGERFILAPSIHWFVDVMRIFSDARPSLAIPVREAPSVFIRLLALLGSAEMKRTTRRLGYKYEVDASSTSAKLGLEWTAEVRPAPLPHPLLLEGWATIGVSLVFFITLIGLIGFHP